MGHNMPFPFRTERSYLDFNGTQAYYDRDMQADDIMDAFGVRRWPTTCMATRTLCGRLCWVIAKTQIRMEMRVFTKCPGCDRVLPIGRLAQHMRHAKRREAGLPPMKM